MRIVEVRESAIDIHSEIRNAAISFSGMDASAVAVLTDVFRDGARVVGFGFSSNGRYSAGGILRARMIPRLLNAEPTALLNDARDNFDPDLVWETVMNNEKPGGHGERSVAVGALDMAIHDVVAKVAGVPLHRWLADRHGTGPPEESVFVYAAGGYYYPGKTIEMLKEEIAGYLDLGYTVVKMKVGRASLAEDLQRLEAVIDVVGDPTRVAIDANGGFDLETALAYGKAIDGYGLFWYEEAGDPLDFELQATLAQDYPAPLATGENLFSTQDARNLVRYGGMRADRDYLQFDPALSYGLVEYSRTLAMLADNGWSARRCIPHGGHQFALEIAAGLHLGGCESYPGVFAPIGGFADNEQVMDGRIAVGDIPGIGIERKPELFRFFKDLAA
jgi:L-alanine-DL-glutamate epimerase-like enolase superfamily enzyme